MQTLKKTLIYVSVLAVVAVAYFAWKLTARGAYESADYTLLDSDGPFETREYPEIMLVTTGMRFESQGDDGSFMRLFGYITGSNDQDQKVAMTTPVFMESSAIDSKGQMGFVIPKQVTEQGIPKPSNDNVQIETRSGGKFAVIRFSGRMDPELFSDREERLRDWMADQKLVPDGAAEVAGYDPPWTPGPFRRNEILFRIKQVD